MEMSQLQLINESPGLSSLVWLIALMTIMYVGRDPAKRTIQSSVRIIYGALRFLAHAMQRTEKHLVQRNREVLLATGREAKERIIDREFERIGDTVHRDLSRYPELQRTLAERIQRIDDDHQQTADVPPDVPGWTKVVEGIAKVPAKADPVVHDVLDAIYETVSTAHERSLAEYRKASKQHSPPTAVAHDAAMATYPDITKRHAQVNRQCHRPLSLHRPTHGRVPRHRQWYRSCLAHIVDLFAGALFCLRIGDCHCSGRSFH